MLTTLTDATHVRKLFLNAPFDAITRPQLIEMLAQRSTTKPLHYLVTPNVDHVVRLGEEPALKPYYEAAWVSVCDSKPIAVLARLLRCEGLLHLPGSTLTELLFRTVIRAGDRVALVVADAEIAEAMRAAFPDVAFEILVAEPNIDRDPAALAACAAFVARSRARFTFIAIGAPRSERIAYHASLEPGASGVALCVGASLEFLTGRKRRAPVWMRELGIEWLHRLSSEPRRLWRRYLLGVGPLARLALREAAANIAARRSASDRRLSPVPPR
ncbi:WecB/TagA/CpsF family glycosyltransferase [Methylobacterium sp. NEAU 140]|uniref:WecB/TagA/CpsF family glycosyltransferase n=1 Tax=Methylobacterium sp. NEAU 140 TaxID=3064945 RepID=UPI002736964D|nr:WecB/TagA/CpsF family glycosyltransferase [Methylobacterium sp. NEAU 140]MDP4023748.1 WecB/TagA/CpsF family glycosyltransferase [Methylobacterium sp. NEAU 140]